MGKFGIVVHGGAGPDSEFIRQNQDGYKTGLRRAVEEGYKILEQGGTAVDAVETAVNWLEDDPLFNAGRGAALNAYAEVEMCASIMRGEDMSSGAVAIVKNVKNPVSLARLVMEKTRHCYLGDMGAMQFAEKMGCPFMPEAYFITDHAFEEYSKAAKTEKELLQAGRYQADRKAHGTVGAVALDSFGNVAAATSTGGLENQAAGRIGDSSMIGTGSYASNDTCAISTTGDGEILIRHVVAHTLHALMEMKEPDLESAARYLLSEKLKDAKGDIGFIAIDQGGNFVMEFNSERMHRAWQMSEGTGGVHIY